MTAEQIFPGRETECLPDIPEKSALYVKAAVAFANTRGGVIVFGAEKDGELVGLAPETVFEARRSVWTAITQGCAGAIFPDIGLRTVGDKMILAAQIPPGRERPYYVKSLGRNWGIFVRTAGETRSADRRTIRALLQEGRGESFDRTPCRSVQATQEDLQRLCRALEETARKYRPTEGMQTAVTVEMLERWGVVCRAEDGQLLPTTAYALLKGNTLPGAAIECQLFTAGDAAAPVREEWSSGPVQAQVEDACRFVEKALAEKESARLPSGEEIREAISNAVLHRSYLEGESIHLQLWPDRLEIVSPGGFPAGQSMARLEEGCSYPRNEVLAQVFSYLGLAGKWGTGIPALLAMAQARGAKGPTIVEEQGRVRTCIYFGTEKEQERNDTIPKGCDTKDKERDDIEKPSISRPEQAIRKNSDTDIDTKRGATALDKQLLRLIEKEPEGTQESYARRLGRSIPTIKRMFARLQADGTIKREGTNRRGRWVVVR